MVLGDPVAPEAPLTAADFEFAACHDHYHFEGWASYELRDAGGTVVVTGHKQAFCLLDTRAYVLGQVPQGFDCDFQGLSSGWADVYDGSLDGQCLDVTVVPELNTAAPLAAD